MTLVYSNSRQNKSNYPLLQIIHYSIELIFRSAGRRLATPNLSLWVAFKLINPSTGCIRTRHKFHALNNAEQRWRHEGLIKWQLATSRLATISASIIKLGWILGEQITGIIKSCTNEHSRGTLKHGKRYLK